MGRKNKSYSRDLKQQVYDRLTGMLKAGEGTSKKEAIINGTDKEKIFSYNSYQTYRKHCNYFINYVRKEHPECTTLKSAKKYIKEWLQSRVDQVNEKGEQLSAWTIQTEAKALGKLYGIQPDEKDYFQAPVRKRENIKRSRGDAERDKHFSKTNNDEFIKFCSGTGCRRNIMEKLEGRDLYTRDEIQGKIKEIKSKANISSQEQKNLALLEETMKIFPNQTYFIHHRNDKGGRDRYAPILGKNTEQIVRRMNDMASNEKVWEHVPNNADIHGYRGDYATTIYKMYARPIDQIPFDRVNQGTNKKYQSGVYTCRKDERGKKLDKDAMLIASKALGHNRLEVVANNYIRGL